MGKLTAKMVLLILISLVTSVFFGGMLYCALFYIHEIGHGVFSICLNLFFSHSLTTFTFSYWINLSILNQYFQIFSFPVPVQTHVSGNSPIIGFGGIFFTVILTSLLAIWISKNGDKKFQPLLYSFPIIVFIEEFVMNILCGYDDSSLIAISDTYCSHLTAIVQNLVPMLFAILIFSIFVLKIKIDLKNDSKQSGI